MRKILFLILCTSMVISPALLHAQNAGIKFRPFVYRASELPPAGERMEFTLKVDGVTDVNTSVRMFLTRDGVFEEIVLTDPKFIDARDRATYYATLYSPLAEMSYRFEATGKKGKVFRSKSFNTVRPCRESTERGELPAHPEEMTPEELLKAQSELVSKLEIEVTQYDNAIDLLGQIQKELDS